MDKDLVILELNAHWDCGIPFGWIPVSGARDIPNTEIYVAKYFDFFVEDVRVAIKRLYKADEVYELVEDGTISFQSLDNCDLGYDGLEHMHTNVSFDFVLYFSHENSVTVGGKALIEEIHKLWPECKNHLWAAPKPL